jgi:hypothetical protein
VPTGLDGARSANNPLEMFLGTYEFDGDPSELLAAYDRFMAMVPADSLPFHACVTRPSGVVILDCCPTVDVFRSFSASEELHEAMRSAGLPSPKVTEVGEVHVARSRDVFITE